MNGPCPKKPNHGQYSPDTARHTRGRVQARAQVFLVLSLRPVVAITNYERGDNPRSIVITVWESMTPPYEYRGRTCDSLSSPAEPDLYSIFSIILLRSAMFI